MSYWFTEDFKDSVTLSELIHQFEIGEVREYNVNWLFWSENNNYSDKILEILTYLSDMSDGVNPVDNYLNEHFGDLEVNPKFAYRNVNNRFIVVKPYNLRTSVIQAIDSIFAENMYKYETLFNTLSLEYNPIWNVDSEETATETRDGRTEATAYGAVTKTMTNASRTNQYTHGAEKETTKNPQVAVTEQRGAVNTTSGIQSGNKVETTTNFNTQMNDTADWYNHDRSEKVTQPYSEYSNKGQHTDTITTPAHNVELDKDSFTDNETLGSHTDTEGTNQHTDTVTKQPYEDETHIVRQGNIGTTTTQQMITEERELAKFSLLDVIVKDFVKALCISVYY